MQTVVHNKLVSYQDINPQATKTIIWLHGWGHNANLWTKVVNQLPKDYRYILVDLPGFGGSQHLPQVASIPEYSEFVIALAEKLKLDTFSLYGHSFGGQIAIDLALKHPKIVNQLFLHSPAGIRSRTIQGKVKSWLFGSFSILKKIIPKYILRIIIKQVSTTDYYNSSQQHQAIMKKIVNYDLSNKLCNITQKTYIVWGDKDTAIPYAGKTMAELLPKAELYVLWECGHDPHIHKPAKLVSTLQMIMNINR